MELVPRFLHPALTTSCAIALTVLSACGDSTGPPPVASDHQVGALALSASEDVVDFADAMDRLLPGIEDRSAALRIAHELRGCAVALELRAFESARASLTHVHQLLSETDMHPSNRAAMKLTLQAVESLIDTRCLATGKCDTSHGAEAGREPTLHLPDEVP